MKQFILAGLIVMTISACGGAGDRTYDKPTVTDSVNKNRSGNTQQQGNDSTPTNINNAYNSDSTKAGANVSQGQGSDGGSVKGGTGSGTSGNQANTKDKGNEKGTKH